MRAVFYDVNFECSRGTNLARPHTRTGQDGHNTADYLQFLNLVLQMLDYNPARRIKPGQALRHAFFGSLAGEDYAAAPASAGAPKGARTSFSLSKSTWLRSRHATSLDYDPSDSHAHSLRMVTAQQRRNYFQA